MADKQILEIESNLKLKVDEPSFGELKGKIDQLNKATSTEMSTASKSNFKETGENAELIKKINNLRRIAEIEGRQLKEKSLQLKKILNTTKEIDERQVKKIQTLKTEIDLLKQKKNLTQENLKALYGQVGGTIGEGGQSPKPPGPIGGGFFSKINPFSKGLLGMSAAAVALSRFLPIKSFFDTRETMRLSAQASAIQGTYGERYQAFTSGKGMEYEYWNQQRAEAMKTATKQIESQKITDKLRLSAGGLALAGGVAAAAFSAPLLLAGGAIAGGIGLLSGKKQLSIISDYLLGENNYESLMQAEKAKVYQQNLQARKQFAQAKLAAGKFYFPRAKTLLGLSRTLNLSDQETFMGENSLLGINANAGFTVEGTQANINKILRAGGSSSDMIQASLRANILERQFGFKEAGTAIGRLTGMGMSAQQADQTLKRLMSEAVRNGVDTSKLPNETKRLAVQMANVVRQTGGNEMMARLLGAGAGNLSMMNIENAQGALSILNSTTSASDSYRLSQRFALMNRNKAFSGLNFEQQVNLANLNLKDLTKRNVVVRDIINTMMKNNKGMSEDEAFEQIKELQVKTIFRDSIDRYARLKDAFKGKNIKQISNIISTGKGETEEQARAVSSLVSSLTTQLGIKPEQKFIAPLITSFMKFAGGSMSPVEYDKYIKQLQQQQSGSAESMGNKMEIAQAKGQLTNMQNLNVGTEAQKSLVSAYASLTENATQLKTYGKNVTDNLDTLSVKLNAFNDNLEKVLEEQRTMIKDLRHDIQQLGGR